MSWRHSLCLTAICLYTFFLHLTNGCQIDGITNWFVPVNINVLDTFSGSVFTRSTTNIIGISNAIFSEGLNAGPYLDVSHSNNEFVIQTNNNYANYEENETVQSMGLTVVFSCTGGSTSTLVFVINVVDTNNNDPQFRPNNVYEFTVIPPLPPGFQITGCLNDIIVRDIDLTTQRINFEIYDSPYFEINYDADSSTTPKEFKAQLRTTTFIRNIPEPLEFRISATDVDLTGDPPRTTNAIVRILSDGNFEFPEELVFTQTFYMATYTEDGAVTLQVPISLQQGYHEQVQFSLDPEPEYSQYFGITVNGNIVLLNVISPLPDEALLLRKIFLVLRADREYTSGTSATIVVQLPEEISLEFEQLNYKGSIVDNNLQLSDLILSQGFESGSVNVQLLSDYASYFSANIQTNRITLSMSPLEESIIEQNNFLNIQVLASTDSSSASTIVTLDIIKNDTITPVFEQTLYEGTYDSVNGLSLDKIVLVQGYDETVQVSLRGEHASFFQLAQSGHIINLVVTNLPTELYSEQNLLLSIEASKPRTVGANAAISIALPAEISLEFEQLNYKGFIVDNNLQLSDLILSQGFESGSVNVQLLSDYASYFSANIQTNRITLSMSPLEESIIEQNNFLNIQVLASTDSSSASTIVTLDIIKNDTITPVFEQTLYEGTYDSVNGLSLDQIVLVQGYDETVQVSLRGEHASFFQLAQSGPNISLVVTKLPTELYSEQNLLLSIEASKPRTVGANAAISIALPAEVVLEFEEQNYKGTIVDNILQLSDLILTQGYETEPVFVEINSEHSVYFSASIQTNRITISMSPLEANVIEQNNFLNLQVIASTKRSSASTVITLDIIKNDTITPVFDRALYEGSYDPTTGLLLDQIVLIQGYDDTVQVSVQGEHVSYFQLVQSGPVMSLVVSSLPTNLYSEQNLLLTIEATKPRTVGANAVISIALPTEIGLEFERKIYNGVIEDNILEVPELILSQGYEDSLISINIHSDYASYFSAEIQNERITLSMSPLSSVIIEKNTFINLLVTASTNRSSSSTTVILEFIKDDTVTPVFERNTYEGIYEVDSGLTLDQIVIVQGFDSTTEISLNGEYASYFQVVQHLQYINVTSSTLPTDLFAEQHLLLSIEASKPRTVGANAAILIALPPARELGFAYDTYSGTILSSNLTIGTIVLSTGYADDVRFSLSGDYASYFVVTNVHNQISVDLQTQIPDNAISENNFLLLTLTASALNAVTTSTTILLEILKEDIITPIFEQNIYNGNYLETSIIDIETIRLRQGFDENVSFRLEGEHSTFFALSGSDNALALTVVATIPQELILRKKVLLFNIIAEKPMTIEANAAISISFPSELTEPTVMRFDKNAYVGVIEQNTLSLDEIILSTGFEAETEFKLNGEYASFFLLSNFNNAVIISTTGTLPTEILNNKFTVLEIEARRTGAVSAFATIIIDITQPDTVLPPLFEEAYYRGVYTVETGLQIEESVTLSQGYDDTVTFQLEGTSAQWFNLSQSGNLLTISTNGIPAEVLETNTHLLFTAVASKPGTIEGRSVIAIDLPKDFPTAVVLRFAQPSYKGQIDNGSLQLSPVTLAGTYDLAIQLDMTGDYATYFTLTRESDTLSIQLAAELPPEIIAENAFIILNLEASYPEAFSGFTTVILEIIKETESRIITPIFEEAYYIGQYSEQGGLVFEHTIRLIQGFDETVSFSLAGDDSRLFTLVQTGQNSYTLAVNTDMIQEINDSTSLVFSIVAGKADSRPGQAAIIIDLKDTTTYRPLRFEQDYYLGFLEDDNLSLSEIILQEGYSTNLSYSLNGDYVDYFQLTHQNGIFVIRQSSSLPTEITETYLIFSLEVRNKNTRSHTTIIIELIQHIDRDVVLSFDQPYYVGVYSDQNGFTFNQEIVLVEGYDASVTFTIEGESSRWFALVISENRVHITQISPIPSAVIANNQQLLFTINAQRPGAVSARATIVIELPNEVIEGEILGFDKINYVGSIVNNTSTSIVITLIQGYSPNVTLYLHGELAAFFTLRVEGSTIEIALANTIPEELQPENRLIILEIQASAPQAVSAYATIIFDLVSEEVSISDSLVFQEAYYIGNYTPSEGLIFESEISLSQGYDENVNFVLEGVNSQWFDLIQTENSAKLILSTPIPSAVIANNNQLLFIINAQKPGSTSARATIVVLISDVSSGERILGFDQINYVGVIDNSSVVMETINLNEGYSSDVTFTLIGELSSFFDLDTQGSTISVSISSLIPEDQIPENKFIVLTIQASAPQTISAYATIVLGIIIDHDDVIETNELAFDEPFYVGNYRTTSGLLFESVISLAEGFDDEVVFSLEGDSSQWFGLSQSNNVVRIIQLNPLPSAVVANNQQLLFTIKAERPGSRTTRATIVILLNDDVAQDQVLGFAQVNYVGTVANTSINLPPIILSEGFRSDVVFTLHGELEDYFNLDVQGATVKIDLINTIPENLLPVNRIILLTLQASAPQTISAYATVVLEALIDNEDTTSASHFEFEEPYYLGSYTATEGLSFENIISLANGYDENVIFSLEGDQSQWFDLTTSENSVQLILLSPIPSAVLLNNNKLLFVIRAERSEIITRATIIIQLPDELNENQVLGFNQIYYLGTISNNTAYLNPIFLIEGYSSDVSLTLHGEFSTYFNLDKQDARISISLENVIPDEIIPENRIIILQIQASAPQFMSAYATIIFEVIGDDANLTETIVLDFDQTYYVGSYTTADGLLFESVISLAEGYDSSVMFSLKGESSEWFGLSQVENSIKLTLTSPIPPAVAVSNKQLLFTILAERIGSRNGRATIVIVLNDEFTNNQVLGFNRISYTGSIDNNTFSIMPIVLSEGYTSDVIFSLHGDLANYFRLNAQGNTVTISKEREILEDDLPLNRIILLEITASAPDAYSAFATIVIEVVQEYDDIQNANNLIFEEAYYTGRYTTADGLLFNSTMSLSEGYDETVEFSLEGDYSKWFALIQTQNSVQLILISTIPHDIIANNHQLIFVIRAERPESTTARATIVVFLSDEITRPPSLGFDRINYIGSIADNAINLPPIILSEGYNDDVLFSLRGDLSAYFIVTTEGAIVTIALRNPIPEASIPSNRIIVLGLQASAPEALPAYATIVLEIKINDENSPLGPNLRFDETYYIGKYNSVEGLTFNESISLAEGYDETVVFALEREHSQWFGIVQFENSAKLVLLNPIPAAVLTNNLQLVFIISAQKQNYSTARATIVIVLTDDVADGKVLGFDRISYFGSIVNDTVNLAPIVLSEGYSSEVSFTLHGEQAGYFSMNVEGPTIRLSLIGNISTEPIPSNGIILIEIQAAAPQAVPAYATIVFEVILNNDEFVTNIQLIFEDTYYIGKYSVSEGLLFDTPISLAEGYDGNVVFALEGEYSQWFSLLQTENSVGLILSSPIPSSVITNYQQLLFVISAQKPESFTARAAIVIQIERDPNPEISVAFDKVLYKGVVQGENIRHDIITINGYTGTSIDIIGDYATLFTASLNNGVVLIQIAGQLTLPNALQHVVLELRASNAGAVLILDVSDSDAPEVPTVTFSASSYVIQVEIGQTGAVGRVEAAADNGERITYSLLLNNEHLQSRLSVTENGELRLSAPADSGVYTFQVTATTVFTQASASATILMSVEALTVCGDDNIVTAPLIIIDRDEEEPHRDLVILNTEQAGCHFSLTNKWPIDQNWLYVDETGLHTRSIDREDPSIAFMTLSQVKVELTLHCDSDVTRMKRSADPGLFNGAYDYGTSTWALAETILYNPRRSIVNLIVNDINDNAPIFVGKENEPIAVGYPVPDLEGIVLPRSLAELQATDADIGVNAELLYWSSETVLSVSPKTGFVHVRNDAQLAQDMLLTINATDRNGEGLTGSLSLIVKLLDINNIAVVTVRDSFLEDEGRILGNLSNAIGYEVRTLRAVVISAQTDEERTRLSRNVADTGSSLELYVYGLIEREPVAVDKLSSDINNAAVVTVNIVSTLSLEDHLEGQPICVIPGRDVGLLAATIVLSILLFILIVAAVVWFLLTRKKAQDYDKFSDTKSLSSQNEALGQNSKPDTVVKPRFNIEELKRSERRLQDMLNAPIEDVNVEPGTSTKDTTINSVAKIPLPDPMAPIVIQDKLKDAVEESDEDEFGERKKPRRKSIVTFNENVEKIIHVEDEPETPTGLDYEVCKL